MAVLGPVNNHRGVARLPGQAGTTSAGHHRHAVLTAHRDRLHPSLDGAGDDHADRHLPVVRRVRAVSPPAARVEPYLPIDPPPQVTLQRARIRRRRTAVAHNWVRQRDAGHQRPPGISPIARLPAADSRKPREEHQSGPPAGAGPHRCSPQFCCRLPYTYRTVSGWRPATPACHAGSLLVLGSVASYYGHLDGGRGTVMTSRGDGRRWLPGCPAEGIRVARAWSNPWAVAGHAPAADGDPLRRFYGLVKNLGSVALAVCRRRHVHVVPPQGRIGGHSDAAKGALGGGRARQLCAGRETSTKGDAASAGRHAGLQRCRLDCGHRRARPAWRGSSASWSPCGPLRAMSRPSCAPRTPSTTSTKAARSGRPARSGCLPRSRLSSCS